MPKIPSIYDAQNVTSHTETHSNVVNISTPVVSNVVSSPSVHNVRVTRSHSKQKSSKKSKSVKKTFVREEVLIDQGYSPGVAKRISAPQRESTQKQYAWRVKEFQTWVKKRGVSPKAPRSVDFCDFFEFKSLTQCPGSVLNYRTALNNYYTPKVVSNQGRENISRLIRSFFVSNPRPLNRTMDWDLNLVLNSLKKKPYEPAQDASFENIRYKTIFLIAFASGKRRSEIHAMSKQVNWSHVKSDGTQQANIPVVLGFLAKNLPNNASGESFKPVVIPSLDGILGQDLMNSSGALLCPVRMLKI